MRPIQRVHAAMGDRLLAGEKLVADRLTIDCLDQGAADPKIG